MENEAVVAWIEAYLDAWRSNDPVRIGALFLVNRMFPNVTVLGFWIGANPGTTTVVLYLSFIASILFVCLGIIGEYVLLLLREAQRRPTAIVESVLGIAHEQSQATAVGSTVLAPAAREGSAS